MGRQINFFMMPEDVAELDAKVKEQGWIIISELMPTQEIITHQNIMNCKENRVYLCLPIHIDLLNVVYIQTTQKYWLKEILSPVVEFRRSIINLESNNLHSGRLFYDKKFLNHKTDLIEEKPKEFIKSADELFRWVTKKFRFKTNESYLVSQTAFDWVNQQHGRLMSANKQIYV